MRRRLALSALALFLVTSPALRAQGAIDPDGGLPLEPERWARFTTDEGTWISLDVSPDGGTVVFDLLGDIYTVPITGGTATRLTHGIAHDMQPRYSPDGSRIVFVSDRSGDNNIWLLTPATGATTQVSKGVGYAYQSPVWTPDGDNVVVPRGGGLIGLEKLWQYHVEGGTGVPLVSAPPGLRMTGPAFGRDPRYIWYAGRQGTWAYNAIFPQYQVGVYDRETGTLTTMSNTYGSAMRPALSPDGKWLTYGSRHDAETGLRLRELATGEELVVLLFPARVAAVHQHPRSIPVRGTRPRRRLGVRQARRNDRQSHGASDARDTQGDCPPGPAPHSGPHLNAVRAKRDSCANAAGSACRAPWTSRRGSPAGRSTAA
jgi:hypothetical protein